MGITDVCNGLNVHWHKLTLTVLRGYLGLYCLITNRLSILCIFFSFDYKYQGIITGRYTSCVASRGAAGVFCHHWPLTAGVSRVARAPALIPLCARLRTAVPETERLNFAKRAPWARVVLRGGGSGGEGVGAIYLAVLQMRRSHVANRHRVKKQALIQRFIERDLTDGWI